jgi:glycerophosphoryl diester phosphodiesterase
VSKVVWPYPGLAAHRGAGKMAPENTLAAVRIGVAFGYSMVEFDVKLSADNVLLLMHDATVDRTTSGMGRVAGKDWRELSQLDAGTWHSPKFAGEPVPTYANALSYCRKNAIAVNAEIKPCPGRERETGAAVAIETKALWGEQEPLPLLSSFSELALEGARAAVPALPRGLLFDALPDDWVARCQRLGCASVNINWRRLTPEVIAAAHGAGLAVACYTCNDPQVVQELIKAGVNTVITDEVATILP